MSKCQKNEAHNVNQVDRDADDVNQLKQKRK